MFRKHPPVCSPSYPFCASHHPIDWMHKCTSQFIDSPISKAMSPLGLPCYWLNSPTNPNCPPQPPFRPIKFHHPQNLIEVTHNMFSSPRKLSQNFENFPKLNSKGKTLTNDHWNGSSTHISQGHNQQALHFNTHKSMELIENNQMILVTKIELKKMFQLRNWGQPSEKINQLNRIWRFWRSFCSIAFHSNLQRTIIWAEGILLNHLPERGGQSWGKRRRLSSLIP